MIESFKYRVHEVAKDLAVDSKDIIALLGKYFPSLTVKHMTELREDHLSVVFEHYTRQNASASLDDYFARAALRKPKTPKPAAPPPVKKVAPPSVRPEQKPVQRPGQPPRPAAPGARPPVSGQRPPVSGQRPPVSGQRPPVSGQRPPVSGQRPLAPGQRPLVAGQQPAGQPRPLRPGMQRSAVPAQAQPQKPKRQQPPKKQAQAREQTTTVRLAGSGTGGSPGAERPGKRVDMRSGQVNLDKYNERYEQIAPGNLARKDTGVKKQKLSQKSAQKGRPFLSRKDKENQKLLRMQMERERRQKLEITLPESLAVSELAARLKIQTAEVVKKLMGLGVMASAGEIIDYDTAAMVAMEIGAKVSPEVVVTIEERLFEHAEDTDDNLLPRSPVVVVMGHVDHGKTSLLDAIRNTNVTAGEAGGITQAIGAYRVEIHGRGITFLDTPGHAAFTSMRARGAQVTDIAILVVAADDGIMPQTVEAINHAKAANVQVIVAINKMDKEDANPERVKQGLTEYGLVAEEWGGDTICVELSAKTGDGIEQLLEMIQLVADMKELKANPDRPAIGSVVEASLDKGRGPVATLLVQNGTLRTGDILIAGTALGRVRVMRNDKGEKVEEAGPSMPVEVTGLSEVPQSGDSFNAVADEKLARELVDQRRHEAKEEQFSAYQKVTMDNLFSQISQGSVKELGIVVKADVQGSVEALTQNLEKIANEEVRVRVIHGAVGAVAESDVMLAGASNAIIVGFNVRPDPVAKSLADQMGVDIRLYRVIYDAIDEVNDAMKGMLAPKFRDVELGRAEVRQVYKISSVGTVAGCHVLEGKITRTAKIRVVRDGIIIADGNLASLKRFKDDVREVAQGYDCGMGLERFNDLKEGDIFEAYEVEQYRD